MAMYYYASKLNEAASCSGCHRKPPQPPTLPPTVATYYPSSPRSNPGGSSGNRRPPMNIGIPEVRQTPPIPPPRPPLSPNSQRPSSSAVNGGGNPNNDTNTSPAVASNNVVTARPEETPREVKIDPVTGKPDLEYKEADVVSGTLEACIDHLRPDSEPEFIYAFLLCHRIYIRPYELLSLLCRRHRVFETVELGSPIVQQALAEMTDMIQILRKWTTNFPYDFRDDRVMTLVRNITKKCADDAMLPLRDEVSVVLQKLLDRLTALEKYEETLYDIPYSASVSKLPHVDILDSGLPPAALARQLTMLELHQLSYVGPEEFIQAFIQISLIHDMTPHMRHHDGKRTKNLECYGKWFNRLNYLVASDILRGSKAKVRARVLEHWVFCARECFNLGNFNSLMAIVGALNMVCISRLKKTWSKCENVVPQLLSLERCMEPSANHSRYRAALSVAGVSTSAPVPCFSITCRDIHFINQMSSNRLPINRINMEKCRNLAKYISEHLARAQAKPDFTRHDPTWEFLQKTPILSEATLELASYEREHPSDSSEKERFKALRQRR